MSSRRPLILMAVLLLLLFGYFAGPLRPSPDLQSIRPAEPLLSGKNSVSNAVVSQNEAGLWQVSFDYYYTGEHARIVAKVAGTQEGATLPDAELYNLKRGTHRATLELRHPGFPTTTRQVVVSMRGSSGTYSTVQVEQFIEWPTIDEWQHAQAFANLSPAENLNRAIALIDTGHRESIIQAKHILERLIQRDASFERAYIELARVAMKTNWGPEGLHHAEGLLSSALQIKPDSADAKILLGYVYTHQRRYKPAEKLFAEAAVANPPNLWLWANWGEVLAKQGKFEPAIAKYKRSYRSSSQFENVRARAVRCVRQAADLARAQERSRWNGNALQERRADVRLFALSQLQSAVRAFPATAAGQRSGRDRDCA